MSRLQMAARLCVVALAALWAAFAPPAHAQDARTALIIGNSAYSFSPLVNPANDAKDMTGVLQAAGFEVILLLDADKARMEAGVRTFAEMLKTRGGVGLFFFAGHGVQAAGENYLIPIGGGIASEAELKDKAITAAQVVDVMAAAKNGLNIFILDACRNNPLAGATKGLSRVDSSSSLFVSFSTSPGAVALDGDDRNSPYAKHLVRSLATPGLNLEETFKRTLKGVYQETAGKQTPWLSSSFFGEFVFKAVLPGAPPPLAVPPGSPPGTPLQPVPQVGPPPAAAAFPALRLPDPNVARIDLSGIYRVTGRNPNGTTYAGMLTLKQAGDQFHLTWWIGKDVYQGSGQLAGRMLVVNWGQQHPVVYQFAANGILDGEWADGSATERLALYSGARQGVAPLPGRYRVEGKNPNGSRYQGSLDLTQIGDGYGLQWRVGRSSYRGTGRMENGVLVVNWGSATPVVYALTAEGSLVGLWDAGRGEETLRPGG